MRHQIVFNALSQQIDDPTIYLNDLRASCEAFDQASEWLERAEAGDATVAAEIPEEHWESIRDSEQISQEAVVVHVNSSQIQAIVDWLKKYIPMLLRKIQEIFMNFFGWIKRKSQELRLSSTSLKDKIARSLSPNYTVKLNEPPTEYEKFLAAVISAGVKPMEVKFGSVSSTSMSNPRQVISELYELAEMWLVTDLNQSPFKRLDIPAISSAQEGLDFLKEIDLPNEVIAKSQAHLASSYHGPTELVFPKQNFLKFLNDIEKTFSNLNDSADFSRKSIEHDKGYIRSIQPFLVNQPFETKFKLLAINYKLRAVSAGLIWRLRTLQKILALARKASQA